MDKQWQMHNSCLGTSSTPYCKPREGRSKTCLYPLCPQGLTHSQDLLSLCLLRKEMRTGRQERGWWQCCPKGEQGGRKGAGLQGRLWAQWPSGRSALPLQSISIRLFQIILVTVLSRIHLKIVTIKYIWLINQIGYKGNPNPVIC